MAVHNNPPLALDRSSDERSRGSGLRPVGHRIVNFLRGPIDEDHGSADQQSGGLIEREHWSTDEEVLPRFPLVRHGYHCATVDAHVTELEQELAEVDQELAELRAHVVPRDEVSEQIKRIGEQTSAVLIAANDQREEIVREAREEAERCVSEATARARLITAEGEARVRELRGQHEAARRERDRLLDDVRSVSVALAALAESGQERSRAPAEGATVEVEPPLA